MATGRTPNYLFPFPFSTDPVNVSGDIEDLATRVEDVLNIEIGNTSFANYLYVSKTGDDNNNGLTPGTAFLTLKAALAAASEGTTIYLKSGDYTEDNPITLPPRCAIIGDSLRTVSVRPLNVTDDIIYVNVGCYISGITFRDHEAPSAAIAYNPDGSAGNITTSPYVQDCSSITTTGKGMYVDGSVVGGLKSMVLDAYTQFNSGGIGVHIDNEGYAQLVSLFTICTDIGILCTNGASCSVTNSNSSFGTYGLKAEGIGPLRFSGQANGTDQIGTEIVVDGLGDNVPIINGVMTFRDGITVTRAGISSGVATITTQENHGFAEGQAVMIMNVDAKYNGIVDVISTPTPDSFTFATTESDAFPGPASGNVSPFFTIDYFEDLGSGEFRIFTLEAVRNPIPNNTAVDFYQRSFIASSGHTFEYVGAGNDLIPALPQSGGIPIQENEIVSTRGGQVFFTSTDQKGDFRIGETLVINRADGTIEGRTFETSLFAVLTPYILAIEG